MQFGELFAAGLHGVAVQGRAQIDEHGPRHRLHLMGRGPVQDGPVPADRRRQAMGVLGVQIPRHIPARRLPLVRQAGNEPMALRARGPPHHADPATLPGDFP